MADSGTPVQATELSQLRVAIVHDWLIGGGAELVVLELHKMFPDAPVYTSYATPEWRQRLDGKVVTGWLQLWPFSKLRKFIPFLRILWFQSLKLNDYDLVISSSGAEAKGIKTTAYHVNYCHAPTHYYWSRYDEYLARPGFGIFDPLARLGLKLLVGPLRRWDFKAAQRPNTILANSTHTKAQVKKYYGRDSQVVFPPIDTARFASPNSPKRHGFIITGRQTPYKRFDLAVAACSEAGLPLTVIGTGPDHAKLRAMAGPTIEFLGFVANDKLPALVQAADAFLFPGLDDFGIAPVEALAAGTPVIAYQAGGALDYVVPGTTGEFFAEQTVASLAATLKGFNPAKYSHDDIKKHSQNFSIATFHKNLRQVLTTVLK